MSLEVIEAVLHVLPQGALLLSHDGKILLANREFLHGFGRTAEDILGRPFFDSFAELEGIPDAARAFGEGSADGSLCHGFITRPRGGIRCYKVAMRSISVRRERWTLAVFELLTEYEGLQVTLQDLEQRVEQARRLKHAITNPLMGLMGNASLLEGLTDLTPEVRQRVENILIESRRIQLHLKELARLGRE